MPRHTRFSDVLCSQPELRAAFAGERAFAAWWRMVLFLHGKPAPQAIDAACRVTVVAAGFRFYAHLYRGLSALLLAAVIFALTLPYAALSAYAALAGFAGCVYLYLCSRLGYAGAAAYRHGERGSTALLITFFVALIAFLSLVLGVISLTVHCLNLLPDLWNVAAASLLLAFGVGSYLVEIVYLVVSPLRSKP